MIYDEKEREAQFQTAEPDDMKISSPQPTQPPAMPKKKRSAIITAGSLILAGAAILGVGISMRGSSSSAMTTVETTYNFEPTAVAGEALEEYTLSDANIIDVTNVTSVKFNCNAADITIIPSDVFSYEVMNYGELNFSIDDNGVLEINYSVDKDSLLNGELGTLYVTVPEQMIDSMEVHLNMGSLSVSDFKKEKMMFDLNAAHLDLINLTASEFIIDVKAGSISADGLISKIINVNNSASDSYFNDLYSQTAEFVSNAGSCTVENGNVSKLTMDGKMGEVNYSGAIEEGADIIVDMGGSSINLNRSPSEYDIKDINSKMSDISINGIDIEEYNSANDSGNIPINITSNISDVSINAWDSYLTHFCYVCDGKRFSADPEAYGVFRKVECVYSVRLILILRTRILCKDFNKCIFYVTSDFPYQLIGKINIKHSFLLL